MVGLHITSLLCCVHALYLFTLTTFVMFFLIVFYCIKRVRVTCV